MSNFLIFKAAFNGSATPAIGTYTAEGATAQFNRNTSISPDYYLYNTADGTAVQWFTPTAETTDFEFAADILTRYWNNRVTYFIIADSTGTTRLRMWSVNDNWHFENSDSIETSGTEYIGTIGPSTSRGFGVFHQFRVRVRKLTASSSSVEVYVDGTLKLTATAGAALVTCAKIGFVGGVNTFGPGTDAGIKNAYIYDLSGGDVIDRGVLSEAFNRFISWAKNIFATKDNVVLRSGGNIMTGTELGRPNDSETFSISGGTTVGGNAGYVKCYGASASGYPGAVEIGGSKIKFIFRNGAIESWAGNQDLGSSGRKFGTAYIKALNINGTAAGNILTRNASEFVDVTTAQTVAGNKTFSGTTETHDVIPVTTDTYDLGSTTKQWNNAYIKSLTINGVACGNILTHNASEFVLVSDLATVATSGSYNDLSNKPTIPTVNNATLTIQRNGTNVQTFTANQSTNVTANITVPTKTSDLTNDSGFITSDTTKIPLAGSNQISGSLIPATTDSYDLGGSSYQWNNAYIKSLTINGVACGDILTHNASEFVPRSGGSVLTGDTLGRTDSTHTFSLCAGVNSNSGGNILLYGNAYSSSTYQGAIGFYALTSGSTYKAMFLFADGTWTWTGQAVQLISDQRLKQQITEIDDKLLDAWEDVNLVQFKYNDAVDEKGKDKARLHTGYVVQQIDEACQSHGVDVSQYGLYCHEEYPQETEEVEVEQADGTKTKERKVIREASEHYSLRYTEVYAVECMYLRRCIARLTARIEELEKGKEQEAGK